MTRSVNTLATVVITLVALLAFGGASLQNFAFALLVGICSGGYHSIFYSAPLVASFQKRMGARAALAPATRSKRNRARSPKRARKRAPTPTGPRSSPRAKPGANASGSRRAGRPTDRRSTSAAASRRRTTRSCSSRRSARSRPLVCGRRVRRARSRARDVRGGPSRSARRADARSSRARLRTRPRRDSSESRRGGDLETGPHKTRRAAASDRIGGGVRAARGDVRQRRAGRARHRRQRAFLDELYAKQAEYRERDQYASIGDSFGFNTKIVGVTFEGRQDLIAGLEPGQEARAGARSRTTRSTRTRSPCTSDACSSASCARRSPRASRRTSMPANATGPRSSTSPAAARAASA